MRSKTFKITKQFTQINREYIFLSLELRKILGLEGEIETMGLYQGRSPNAIQEGKSAENDKWIITTKEIK